MEVEQIPSNIKKTEIMDGCCEDSRGAPTRVPTGGVIVSTIGRQKGRLGEEGDSFEVSQDRG